MTYDIFDSFVKLSFPSDGSKYQTLDDIDEKMREAAEKEIDALCDQLKE
jgi:hypothetical protein